MRYLCILAFAIGRASGAGCRPACSRHRRVIHQRRLFQLSRRGPPALSPGAERSQLPGAQVVAIEEHVDYWNQLGWTDPFSSPQYRARQNDYAMAFKAKDILHAANGGERPDRISSAAIMSRAYHEIEAAAQTATTWSISGASPNSRDPDLLDLSVQVTKLQRPPNGATLMFTWR